MKEILIEGLKVAITNQNVVIKTGDKVTLINKLKGNEVRTFICTGFYEKKYSMYAGTYFDESGTDINTCHVKIN